ncbi:MAG: DNA alkylation repair protein [Pirellulales bacterium]|nr:DNA alkylation repair protein [Pirellulales bacterium]
MNTVKQVMTELKKRGSEQTRKTLARHGVTGEMFGVKIADLKTIVKQIKGNQTLALELYQTGNYDAMYLAGLVADGAQMTKKEIESWAKNAAAPGISEYVVPWVASENAHARSLALKWIQSKREFLACSGWNTYVGILATRPDEELDLDEIKSLLDQVVEQLEKAPNAVRYTMNGFVIGVGAYVKPLLKEAKRVAKKIGTVSVDMGDTACKVPLASSYIAKIEQRGKVGKKRRTLRC